MDNSAAFQLYSHLYPKFVLSSTFHPHTLRLKMIPIVNLKYSHFLLLVGLVFTQCTLLLIRHIWQLSLIRKLFRWYRNKFAQEIASIDSAINIDWCQHSLMIARFRNVQFSVSSLKSIFINVKNTKAWEISIP